MTTACPTGETEHLKPRLLDLLGTLRMDVSYHRAAGNHMYFRDNHGREIAVLDMLGGYGSLLLGHAHPDLVAEAGRLLSSGCPQHAQISKRESAMQLARELSRRAGSDFRVIFGNSGTEAVEAAMKHAMLETGGRTFIALENAFHGKTLGALQLTANPAYRARFELAGLRVIHVPADDPHALNKAFGKADDLAGFIFEPILGEGGIRPVSADFAQLAAARCAERGVPLIADECQTGMGRTGTFLASKALGIMPDYILLSKALGGGIAKISALLIAGSRYLDEFDLLHTSTYAEDDFSCGVALATLALTDDTFPGHCQDLGDRLLMGLEDLRQHYPDIIADVRGRGLMLAVSFQRRPRSASFVIRCLDSQNDLVPLLAGYLLRTHRIRVAPTLSDPLSLRIEPSALLKDHDIARFLTALDDVCQRLRADDGFGLTRFILTDESAPPPPAATVRHDRRPAAYHRKLLAFSQQSPPPARAAWLCHLPHADDLLPTEPAFGALTEDERERYLAQWIPRAAPVLMTAADVTSATGSTVRILPILLPVTSRWMKSMLESGRSKLPQALVQAGVDFARELGCSTVSLGQYTSIATLNGLRTASHGMGLTTGNSYALALALEAVSRAMHEQHRKAADSVLVIAGAAGNIGRTCAEMLTPFYRRTILLGSGRASSLPRLTAMAARLPRATASLDPSIISQADVLIAATNAVDAPLDPAALAPGALVCDLSVPSAIATSSEPGTGIRIIRGGIAALPGGTDVGFPVFPLSPGHTYGCMAEAMILALEGIRSTRFTGNLSPRHVTEIATMAGRHGFHLANCMPSSLAPHLSIHR
jgi:acetylornithine/succinyldiaminopimelate/putrescine aminotransferase/predicted amino acid dehydrogenase